MRVVMRENADRSGTAEGTVYPHFVRDRPVLTAKYVQKSTSSLTIAFYCGVLSF
jgi:hypothetical protein